MQQYKIVSITTDELIKLIKFNKAMATVYTSEGMYEHAAKYWERVKELEKQL